MNMPSWLTPASPKRRVKVTIEEQSQSVLGVFQGIGPLSKRGNPSKYDILDKFADLPPAAQRLFNELKLDLDERGYVNYHLPFDRASESTKYKSHSRNVAYLKSQQFVKLLTKSDYTKHPIPPHYGGTNIQVFIVNPEYIRTKYYNESKILWRKLV